MQRSGCSRWPKYATLLDKVDEHLVADLDVRPIRDRHKLASTLLKVLKGAGCGQTEPFFDSSGGF